jgi:hypothetical protein
VQGRKRHIIVDSLGMPLAVIVTAADVEDTSSRLPPTDTAQLLDEAPVIRQLVQRLGKRAGEARSFCVGQRQAAFRRDESSPRVLRSNTPT